MSKIQKSTPSPYVAAISKWSAIWKWDDYFMPENVRLFEEIYAYFKKSIGTGISPIKTYWNWMEEKGAVKSVGNLGTHDYAVIPDNNRSDSNGMTFEKYEKHRDMWSKFTDWLHHKEQKAKAAEKFEKESINNLAETMTVTPVEVDEVTKHALDNF